MKKTIFYLLFISLSFAIQGQNTPIYNWQEHLSYSNAKLILEIENNIYCATENGLFYYNKEDYTINRLNKITGLSDVGISAINYDSENNIIIISYHNCNIDLIKGDEIINITDIKDKLIIGEKKINNIDIEEGVAYLSTSFGLLLMDLKKEEIIDTYKIGENGNFVGINDCAINDTSILAATTDGLYYADINSSFLFDFNSWIKHPDYNEEITDITITPTELIVNNLGHLFFIKHFNNTTMWVGDTTIDLFSSGTGGSSITDTRFIKIQDVLIDNENILWVADSVNSLMKFENYTYQSTIKPNGPSSNLIKKLSFLSDDLYVLHDTEKNSISKTSSLIDWGTLNPLSNITSVEKIGEEEFLGSSENSMVSINSEGNITFYDNTNTNNIIDSSDNIVCLIKDENNVLWGTNSHSYFPLFSKDLNNNWTGYSMPFVANQSTEIGEMIIDNYNQKWGIKPNNGLFVYNDNNTISDKSDDQFTKITTATGEGNLPNDDVYCLTNDLDGNIWVGTKEGVCVFYSPSAVFSGYNFDAQQIIVEENGFGQYLLESEIIYSIAIDGGNRKWIGTLESGLYLLSEDGTEEFYHFTTENSPLLSNTILDVEINHKTAEVFISTDKGLMSFRNDATKGTTNINSVEIFPNPVRESYYGNISINGLAYDSNVKITDVSGNLVFETTSNGAMAIWDGTDANNNRVGTGVYLVFCSDKYGNEKAVGKILFIH